MEKQSSKTKLLSYLPKSAAISFSSQPFSPGRDKHRSLANNKGFSGSIISIVPVEARATTRNGSFHGAQEPTSPKISCIGQIKHKKKACKAKREKKELDKAKGKGKEQASNGSNSIMRRLFRGGSKINGGRKVKGEDVDLNGNEHAGVQVLLAPSLGQVNKFSSGREAFSDFDYRFGVGGAAAVMGRHRGYFSDEEKGESDEEDDGFLVPYSAPLGGGGVGKLITLEPKKEINIWKRRTMAPPRPLQV